MQANYHSKWKYFTKKDHCFIQSEIYPDLSNEDPLKTIMASMVNHLRGEKSKIVGNELEEDYSGEDKDYTENSD